MSAAFQVRRLSIAEILDEGFRLFRHGFSRLLFFQLILYVPTTAILAYGILAGGDVLIELAQGEGPAPDVPVMIAKLIGYVVAFIAIQIVAGAIAAVATSRAVADSYLGRAWTTMSILKEAFRSAPAAVGLSAILTLVLLFAFGAPLGIGAAIAAAVVASSSGGKLLVALSILFGLALGGLALAGAFLLVLRYGLALVALSVEHASMWSALSRSVELMRGRYLRALLLFLVLLAVNLLLSGALSAFLPTPDFKGVDPDELRRLLPQMIRGQLLSTILGQVAGIFVQVYSLICWTLFYFTARCEAEAFDLSHLAERALEG